MRVRTIWTVMAALVMAGRASMVVAAPSLSALAPYGTEAASEARAITPDGRWIAGFSGPEATGRGVLWDAQNPGVAINVLNSAGGSMQAQYIRGIAPRTVNGYQELALLGKTSGTNGPTYWYYRPADGTFGWKHRHTNEANVLPTSNALAPHATQADAFYSTWSAGGATGAGKVGKVWGPAETAAPSTEYDTKNVTTETGLQAVSSNGWAFGWRYTGTPSVRSNYMFRLNEDGVSTTGGVIGTAFFNGLNGTPAGEAWACNANGTQVAGYSPVSDGRTGNWPYLVTNPGASQMIVELPSLNTAATHNQGIVYGMSADGRWGVGRDYSHGQDRAVLWDLQNLTVLDLTAFATEQGILGDFSAGNGLRRAYSIGVNAQGQLVITGLGITSAGASRAFLLTVPEPTTLGLLALGVLPLLRRRRR